MGHHQVPACAQYVADVALIVRARHIGGQQVTRNGNMAKRAKSVTHCAGVFTSDQHAKAATAATVSHEAPPAPLEQRGSGGGFQRGQWPRPGR